MAEKGARSEDEGKRQSPDTRDETAFPADDELDSLLDGMPSSIFIYVHDPLGGRGHAKVAPRTLNDILTPHSPFSRTVTKSNGSPHPQAISFIQ